MGGLGCIPHSALISPQVQAALERRLGVCQWLNLPLLAFSPRDVGDALQRGSLFLIFFAIRLQSRGLASRRGAKLAAHCDRQHTSAGQRHVSSCQTCTCQAPPRPTESARCPGGHGSPPGTCWVLTLLWYGGIGEPLLVLSL